MKDFDFDELDRAVNSVLTQKKAPAVESTTVTPASDPPVVAVSSVPEPNPVPDTTTSSSAELPDVPVVTIEESDTEAKPSSDTQEADVTSTESPIPDSVQEDVKVAEPISSEPVAPVQPEPMPSTHAIPVEPVKVSDEVSSESIPSQNSPTTTPQKRGKFMDVVRPSATVAVKPRVTHPRGGVTLQPSSDFSIKAPAINIEAALNEHAEAPVEPVEPSPKAVVETPLATPTVEPVSTPKPEEPLTQEPKSEPVPTTGDTVTTSTMFPQPEPELVTDPKPEPEDEVAKQPPVMNHSPLHFEESKPPVEVTPQDAGVTPFIPDVAVEKRPLNSFTQEESAESNATAPSTSPTDTVDVASVQTVLPKEFNKEIMRIEANESVQSSTAAPTAPAVASAASSAVIASPVVGLPLQADQQAHPVFDPTSVHQPLIDAKSSTGHKTMWVIIFVALFIVGAALGVLYFLYGQHL